MGLMSRRGCAALPSRSLALASTVHAQARVDEKVNLAVTGDVTAIDPDARMITVKSTNDEGSSTRWTAARRSWRVSTTAPSSISRSGGNVAVNGHRTGDARLVTFIKVVKAP